MKLLALSLASVLSLQLFATTELVKTCEGTALITVNKVESKIPLTVKLYQDNEGEKSMVIYSVDPLARLTFQLRAKDNSGQELYVIDAKKLTDGTPFGVAGNVKVRSNILDLKLLMGFEAEDGREKFEVKYLVTGASCK